MPRSPPLAPKLPCNVCSPPPAPPGVWALLGCSKHQDWEPWVQLCPLIVLKHMISVHLIRGSPQSGSSRAGAHNQVKGHGEASTCTHTARVHVTLSTHPGHMHTASSSCASVVVALYLCCISAVSLLYCISVSIFFAVLCCFFVSLYLSKKRTLYLYLYLCIYVSLYLCMSHP